LPGSHGPTLPGGAGFNCFGCRAIDGKELFVTTYDLVGGRIVRDLTATSEGLEGEVP
jgi:hypothetical protein